MAAPRRSIVHTPSVARRSGHRPRLRRGFLSSYVAEHTYSDYRATVSATNMGKSGVTVREQYLSVRP